VCVLGCVWSHGRRQEQQKGGREMKKGTTWGANSKKWVFYNLTLANLWC
jgi:hypothetical protein